MRRLRGEREKPAVDEAADRDMPPTSEAVRMAALAFTSPLVVMGWWLTSHAQTGPSGGFQGGHPGHRVHPCLPGRGVPGLQAVQPGRPDRCRRGGRACGFVAIGLAATATGLAWPGLANFLPKGQFAGAVSSGGTIPLISFFVGLEVAAAFILHRQSR